MEAIVLAGGRGTRLSGALPADLPKPLASVAGRPFLYWLLEQLSGCGMHRVVLSVGWQAGRIIDAIGTRFLDLQIIYSREETPLGTGGAMKLALRLAQHPAPFVLNGDSFANIPYSAMRDQHARSGSRLTVACTPVADTARYGRVEVADDRILRFNEKGQQGPGLINAGVYLLQRDLLEQESRASFSFEQDFLAAQLGPLSPRAHVVPGPFIDIGVPADLLRAQSMFPPQRQ